MRLACLALGVFLTGCDQPGAGKDGGTDAEGSSDAEDCSPSCHWDCFGGSQCVAGTAWANGFAPRQCCHHDDPWPGPGPVCAAYGRPCQGGACVTPDRRYAACLELISTPAAHCMGADCRHLLLYCPEGAAKPPGALCGGDADCRPAAEGVPRLRCDTVMTGTCVEDERPAPPADYGAGCGLTVGDVPSLDGETAVERGTCSLCQVMRVGDGCLRQGCTVPCSFNEDCPADSICLCGGWGSPVIGYCAAATDRETSEGRAAGLPSCP